MYLVEVGGHPFEMSRDHLSYRGKNLPTDSIEGIRIVRTNTHVNGAWVRATRILLLRARDQILQIDCSSTLPDASQVDAEFGAAYEGVWTLVGERLVRELLSKLLDDQPVQIGGVLLERSGVWLDGSWRFLVWKGKPKLVSWADLRVLRNEGVLVLQSNDYRFRNELKINDTENAIVLDQAIRFLFRDENWKGLAERR